MHGPPPHHAYPPPGWQPPPPPKRSWAARHKILTGVAAVVTVGVIAGLLLPDPEPTSTGPAAAATTPAPPVETSKVEAVPPAPLATPRTPGVGQSARDGQFEFVVQKIRCGVPRVGSAYLDQKAQGQFCLITVKVTNTGDEARTFDASSQHASDAAGRTFDADSAASLYANDNGETFLNDINPGNTIVAVVVFDVPKDVALPLVELHDSPFSDGVTIALAP